METSLLRGLHVLPHAAANQNQQLAKEHNLRVWRLDLREVRSKSALFVKIREALALPDYLRDNWDSLEECLRDLDDDTGWLLIFDSTESLLALPKQELNALSNVLSAVASFWAGEGKTFGAIFVGSQALKEAMA